MTATRRALVVVGVLMGLWGLWLMRDFAADQLVSTGVWLAGGILLHDAVLAPVTVGLGVLAARLLPGHARVVAGVAFVLWATLTVTFFPVISGQGGKAGNDTILGRPYFLSWLAMTVILAAIAVVAGVRRRASTASATDD